MGSTDEEKRIAIMQARDDLWNAAGELADVGLFNRAQDCAQTMQRLERAFGLEPKPCPY